MQPQRPTTMQPPKSQARQRCLALDDARLPLTITEVTIIRRLLELAVAAPQAVIDRSAPGARREINPSIIRGIARELLEFLLTGRLDDPPGIRAWRKENGMVGVDQRTPPAAADTREPWEKFADEKAEQAKPDDAPTAEALVERMIG